MIYGLLLLLILVSLSIFSGGFVFMYLWVLQIVSTIQKIKHI